MKKKTWKIIVRHLVLALLAIIWLIPIVWLVVTSLSTTKGVSYQHFFPEHWTLANYHQLFFKTDTAANFPAWFKNTFIVAFFTCIVSSPAGRGRLLPSPAPGRIFCWAASGAA